MLEDSEKKVAVDMDISGFDVNLGLSYAGGSAEAYFSILKSYVETGEKRLHRYDKISNENGRMLELYGKILKIGNNVLGQIVFGRNQC